MRKKQRQVIQNHAGIDFLLNKIATDAVKRVKGDVVLQESEGCLDPPAQMVQLLQCGKIKGTFRKVGKEILRALSELYFDQSDREMEKTVSVGWLYKIKPPPGMKADKLIRMSAEAFPPAACNVEFQRSIKLIGIGKKKPAEERVRAVSGVKPEKKAMAGHLKMCQEIKRKISPVGDKDCFSGNRIVV